MYTIDRYAYNLSHVAFVSLSENHMTLNVKGSIINCLLIP